MSFQLEERRVSEDGFAYSKNEFLSHYNGLTQWNAAPIETKYDKDGLTYTQRAFFEHYGNLDQWYAAIPANAYLDSQKFSSSYNSQRQNTGSSFPQPIDSGSGSYSSGIANNNNGLYSDRSTGSIGGPTGWSSDRGPQAPDDGFFDTQGYGDHFHSYDDMAYSSNLYSHGSSRSGNGSHQTSSTRPSTSVSKGQPPYIRHRTPSIDRSRSSNINSTSITGSSLTSTSTPSSPSSSSPKRRRSGRVERSLSSLGRKLFSHIPPKQLKVMVTPNSPSTASSNKRKTTAVHPDDGTTDTSNIEVISSIKNENHSLYNRKKNLLARKDPKTRHHKTSLLTTPSISSSSTATTAAATTTGTTKGSLPRVDTESNTNSSTINIGDYISVQCNITKHFRLCRVLDMKDGKPPQVQVHFEGTPIVPDEYLPFDSSRLAPFDRSQASPMHGGSKKVLVAKSKYVNVGDFCEVRIFCDKKNDFKFQMAQIVSLDNVDGSIRVHFEGISHMNDEVIPMADVPLRVRSMGNGISPLNKKSPPKDMKSTDSSSCQVKTTSTTTTPDGDTSVHNGKDISPINPSSISSTSTDRDETTPVLTDTILTSSDEETSDELGDEDELRSNLSASARISKIKKMKSSKSELSKALRKLGLRIIKIAADGNCLFRAVAHQLYVDVSRHEELRKQCCNYMLGKK